VNGNAENYKHSTDMRTVVLDLAREILDYPDISIDDDFFSVGGDSSLAAYLVGELVQRTGLRIRVSLLLANPVLDEFCMEVEVLSHASAPEPAEPQTPLMAMLKAAGLNNGGRDAH
jgi:hypothetical protein